VRLIVITSIFAMSLILTTDPIPLLIDADGVIRVGQTRVTLDTVVTAFLEGSSIEEIIEQYPALGLSDIYSVIGYYLRHKREVDNYILNRQRHAVEIKLEAEKRFNPIGIRERLLARQQEQMT
jgi:uncharacterized protein (DUF433 family)